MRNTKAVAIEKMPLAKPLVSIMLPVFNGAARLPYALQSLFAQSYPNLEIIVCDDGSTDETLAILEFHQSRNFPLTIIKHEKNQGIIAAANSCLSAAKGEFVARMDHDDMMHPEKITKQVEFAATLEGDYLIATQIAINDLMGLRSGQWKYINWQNTPLTPEEHKREIYVECPLCNPTILMKREVMNQIGGYQTQSWVEDYDLFFRAHIAGVKLYKMPEKLLTKSLHPLQATWRDPACTRVEFMNAKAHYFFQDPTWMGKRRLYIVGTGSTGKQVADALSKVGRPPVAFLDDRDFEPNKTLRGIKCMKLDQDFKANHWDGSSLILFAIADPVGKTRAKEVLKENGFDFFKEVLPWV